MTDLTQDEIISRVSSIFDVEEIIINITIYNLKLKTKILKINL